MLLDGRKFHLRVHALAVGDIEVYVHKACLALVASEAFSTSEVCDPSHVVRAYVCLRGCSAYVHVRTRMNVYHAMNTYMYTHLYA